MSNTTITEACGCGATFTITTTYPGSAGQLADKWRRDHGHAESVGICGDKAPLPVMPDGSAVAPVFCDLKAGHPGAHSDGQGHWTTANQEDS